MKEERERKPAEKGKSRRQLRSRGRRVQVQVRKRADHRVNKRGTQYLLAATTGKVLTKGGRIEFERRGGGVGCLISPAKKGGNQQRRRKKTFFWQSAKKEESQGLKSSLNNRGARPFYGKKLRASRSTEGVIILQEGNHRKVTIYRNTRRTLSFLKGKRSCP